MIANRVQCYMLCATHDTYRESTFSQSTLLELTSYMHVSLSTYDIEHLIVGINLKIYSFQKECALINNVIKI